MKAEIKINQVSENQYELESHFTYEGDVERQFPENWFIKDMQGFAIQIYDKDTRIDPVGYTHVTLNDNGNRLIKPEEILIYKFPFDSEFTGQEVLVSFAYRQFRLLRDRNYKMKLCAKNIDSNFVDLEFDLS